MLFMKVNFDSYRLKKWADRVKKRDGYRCTKCGSRTKLHAHHKKQKSIYPKLAYRLSNGTTLCERCHHRLHKVIGYGKKNKRKVKKQRRQTKRTNQIRVQVKKYRKKYYKVKVKR
jgi:5-methylcytosine-specific restriction endonuclease McrA